ncbi:bifunctional hydroxymethylpyrimidine kinase/phosphomethylpyrimidine kinase [Bacillus sp. V3B]|uniref:bifunctional hydroxymethylpyrimidine kinase/phosphomethylpyrimidine kinase n=1 Tax=Bacillus sp. V3B TaxID=2804915 RepID=UPI00210E9ECE|nr:bifunctional hydroxymethylpyrimidine kinase/phosphomethylpyrimidine kinase [Bacillus sp. V3B]MCQ6276145.1 bifunctional hydroxymethylpyrimidine kinase/phosphomethylpyrimidine kinase [Bacillus sp. V3B]
MNKALTIAGSDSGGGAGIQADLKTFQELDVFGMSAITAVTAQNTLGVHGVHAIPPELVAAQIDAVSQDIGVDALKTGMLFSTEIIEVVAEKIKKYGWGKVVVDPVMIAKGGSALLQQEAITALKNRLLPLAYVVTPNIPEAEEITGMRIQTDSDKIEAAKKFIDLGVKHVVIKGGHDQDSNESVDLLFSEGDHFTFKSKRIATKNTHGTGCTFSAAMTAELAKGASVFDAVSVAKRFISMAIEEDLQIGNGHGPTNHWAYKRKGRVSI